MNPKFASSHAPHIRLHRLLPGATANIFKTGGATFAACLINVDDLPVQRNKEASFYNNKSEFIRRRDAIALPPVDACRLYMLREPFRVAAKPNNPTTINARVSGSGTC